MKCIKPQLKPKTRRKHTSVSQQTSLRQDTETTRCHSGMKREEMRLRSVSTCGNLKEEGKDFTVVWRITAKAKPYTNLIKRCNLCVTDKFFLITKPHMATLNKRNELISTCRHQRKFIRSKVYFNLTRALCATLVL